jgi:UDP-N-acetylmuramoylalanine--D-glutamate ligase
MGHLAQAFGSRSTERIMPFADQRVTVMGLGHFGGGVAVARWLARQGTRVTVTDLADASTLSRSLDTLREEPIAVYHLGGHCEDDFRQTDLVVVNPAVRPDNPYLRIAADTGIPLISELELFLQACPARVVGVTGSNGKSTTAAMTAAILRADGRTVHLGGNIGRSLLDQLDHMTAEDWVVLEISSFQLYYLNATAPFPHVAVVTNCTPNHLDWHGTMAHYVAAKQRLLTGQQPSDLAVLNTHDPEVDRWAPHVRGRQLPLVDESVLPLMPVPGRHNREDACCAATAALGIGCTHEAVHQGLATYRPLPERLELVAVIDGRRFYDDSSATTPESTIAALEALEGRTWLLAGGSDKGIDLRPLSEAIVRLAAGAAFYGAVREALYRQVQSLRPDFPCVAMTTLDEALLWCSHHARSGENIVLSPACASRDQFQNYRARGAHFVELVRAKSDVRRP